MTSAVHRINLEEYDAARYPGGWVDIKGRRSWADQQRIDGAAMTLTGSATAMVAHPDLLARGLAALETSVIAWSLTDDSGEALPANRTGFMSDSFDAGLGDWLVVRIDAHYTAGRRPEEERKNLVAPSIPL